MLQTNEQTKNSLFLKIIGIDAYESLIKLENTARVESVFDNSFYINIGENQLLRFIKYEDYISTSSAVINTDDGDFSLKSIGIHKGMEVLLKEDDLLIGDRFKVSGISDITKWYPPELPQKKPVAELEVIKLNLRVMRDIIYTCPSREGLVPLLENIELLGSIELFLKPQKQSMVERARPGIEKTMWGLFSYDIDTVINSAETIIGLGPGLTPSCDDFLGGLILSLKFGEDIINIGGPQDKRFYNEVATRIYQQAQGKTTVFSLNMLREATKGICPHSVVKLINTLLTGGPDQVANDSKTLVKMGDTSGADTAIGMYYGIRFLISKLENLEVLDGTA